MAEGSGKKSDLRRREFLGRAAAAGGVAGAAAGSSGCSAMLMHALDRAITPEAIDAFLARLDEGLALINDRPVMRIAMEELFGSEALAEAPAEALERLDESEGLGRRMLRAFLVAGMIHDLPVEARSAPAVQRHLEQLGPELDETLAEATQLIASCPESMMDDMAGILRDEPDLAMRVGEALDRRSPRAGMGRGGRGKLRQTCAHVAGRMRRQPPELLIDDCLDRAERLVIHHGADAALWRQLTTEAPLHALWQPPADHRREPRAKSYEEIDGEPAPPESEPLGQRHRPAFFAEARSTPLGGGPGPSARNERLRRAGVAQAAIGGSLSGIGGLMLGLGLASGTISGAGTATAGGIILGIGVIVLIVGLILIGVARYRRRRITSGGEA